MTTITDADRDAAAPFTVGHGYLANGRDYSGDYMVRNGHWDDKPLVQAFAAHREAAEARAREAQPPNEELADEIAEAISDTLDMDWKPSWAAPNIIAIINRERRLARIEGAKAMQEAVAHQVWLYGLRHREDQNLGLRHRTKRSGHIEACGSIEKVIRALDPAQIAAQEPKI